MKKIRRLLPMLVAMLLLAAPTMRAEAADENYVQVKSGSTSAKVTFTVENVLALEGTVSTGKTNGFKPASVQLTGTAAGSLTKYGEDGDRFVVIGSNMPADIKVTANLESSSPMKDGKYSVTLKYGKTTTSGRYATGDVKAYIYVGIEPETLEEEDSSTTASQDRTTTSGNTTEKEVAETITKLETESNRADLIGMIDYSVLKAALEDAESIKGRNMSKTELEELLTAIENGQKALESTSQSDVDAAADALDQIILELGGPAGVQVADKDKGEGLGLNLWVILLILALILLIAAALLIWRLRKKRRNKQNYDGAPMVDYDIGDDDAKD